MASSLTSVIVFSAVIVSAAISNVDRGPTNAEWKAKQAAAKGDEGAAAADQSKMAAVDKVVSMLEDLQLQVLAEGESEAASYNKFACFCKTTQKDKSSAIKTGKSDKDSLGADIKKFSNQRDALDTRIGELQDDIKKANKRMTKATGKSNAANAVYKTNDADLVSALASLNSAIKVLKGSNGPTLLELQSVGKTVQQAALMADALGLGGEGIQKTATFFLQQGDVPVEMEDYKFHSSGIIDILEKLLGDFRDTKGKVDADEVSRVSDYDMLMQKETDLVKAKTLSLNQKKQARDERIEDIGTASQELTTTSAQLLDDMQYLDELNTICSDKAKTWDQRTKLRANELTALTQATGIVKATVAAKTQSSTIRFAQTGTVVHLAEAVVSSDSAMQAIEAEAEETEGAESPPAFLQKRSVQKHASDPDGAKQMIIALLSGKGKELKSTVLAALATKIAADPFVKIKKLIQELIERLLTEAANESNQKGWCDKSTADATQRRTMAADAVEDANAEMAKLAALSDKLGEEIKTLKSELAELRSAMTKAEKMRKQESKENAKTVSEAKAGLDAINMAIDILDKFYKTSAKAKVDLNLAQGPMDDAPDAGFANGEAYQGAGAESGGIVGMMEVIQSDFERTISETNESEKAAYQDHLQFMTESKKSEAEKVMARNEKTKLKDEADTNYNEQDDKMSAEVSKLSSSLKELMELKAACVDTGMSYADRVAMREQEIASLKKALCILGAYAEFGPDGLADAC